LPTTVSSTSPSAMTPVLTPVLTGASMSSPASTAPSPLFDCASPKVDWACEASSPVFAWPKLSPSMTCATSPVAAFWSPSPVFTALPSPSTFTWSLSTSMSPWKLPLKIVSDELSVISCE
jgi:hypothetical protein